MGNEIPSNVRFRAAYVQGFEDGYFRADVDEGHCVEALFKFESRDAIAVMFGVSVSSLDEALTDYKRGFSAYRFEAEVREDKKS